MNFEERRRRNGPDFKGRHKLYYRILTQGTRKLRKCRACEIAAANNGIR
jgi:hypothetical protein